METVMKFSKEPKVIPKKIRRQFKVTDKKDVDTYKSFLINRKWGVGGCPFVLEEPFDSIPGMIENKLIRYFLKIKD